MNKKKKRRVVTVCILAILAILAFFINLFQPQNIIRKDYDDIISDGVLRIVTNYDPVGYYVSSDTIAGYNYELLTALQQYSKLKFEISVDNNLENSLQNLNSGKYDVVARNIAVNANLRNIYSFTKPIINNKLVLIQRKAEYNNGVKPIRNHLYLGKKKIYTPKDSPSIFRLENLSHEIGDTIYIIQDDLYEANELALMVAAGDIDFTVCDIKTAKKIASKTPELDIETDIGFTHFEAWAVRATSPILLDSLDIWIDRFKTTKEYADLYKKYYK